MIFFWIRLLLEVLIMTGSGSTTLASDSIKNEELTELLYTHLRCVRFYKKILADCAGEGVAQHR
jgi:hypothetical protein